ncbi:hypothetical protein RB653_001676 [Dictyostelium firmibasis]|uniref:Uncharacterized protein n=1 Tax=Dictyostelium firmibasis TaxID=79012 RepID=A0AAN7TXE4_9MYCE
MKIVIILIFFLLNIIFSVCESDNEKLFIEWTRKHNKIYSNKEFNSKFKNFLNNKEYVDSWNKMEYETILELNIFADLSREEYINNYLGNFMDISKVYQKSNKNFKYDGVFFYNFKDSIKSIDWRNFDAVTPVKNQGTCSGAGYSFSAIGSIESAHFIKNNELITLSEQNLIDCSIDMGNNGCKGGLSSIAFDYIIKQRGIDSEFSYPYEGHVIEPYEGRGRCRYNSFYSKASISSYIEIERFNENQLTHSLLKTPVSVMIDASQLSFMLYKSGVYMDQSCSSTKLNHGLLNIGFGETEDGIEYYILKNSFGSKWGNKGYIHLSRNSNNHCGVASFAFYPII